MSAACHQRSPFDVAVFAYTLKVTQTQKSSFEKTEFRKKVPENLMQQHVYLTTFWLIGDFKSITARAFYMLHVPATNRLLISAINKNADIL